MNQIGIYLVNQNSGQVYPLDSEQNNIIGRGVSKEENSQASILLPHPEISRQHADIYLSSTSQLWKLRNLSRNGVLINDKPVELKQSMDLAHGDKITIGPNQLIFYEKFHGGGTMEHKISPSSSTASEWEEEKLTPFGSLIENVAIFFFLGLTAFILVCCFT